VEGISRRESDFSAPSTLSVSSHKKRRNEYSKESRKSGGLWIFRALSALVLLLASSYSR